MVTVDIVDDGRDERIAAYVLKANWTWASRENITCTSSSDSNDACIMSNTVLTNPSQTEAVVALDEGIRRHWKQHGDMVQHIWRGIKANARRNLLAAISPDLCTEGGASSEVAMKRLLLPEFASLNTFCRDPQLFINVIENSVLSHPLNLQYRLDARVIRDYIEDGKLEPDDEKENLIALLEGGSHVGEPMSVDTEKLKTINPQLARKFMEMIEDGVALEGPIFAHVLERRHLLLQLVALVLDEVQGAVVLPATCANPGCNNTYFVTASKEEEEKSASTSTDVSPEQNLQPLRCCQRCKRVAYCSRDCQVQHWKQGHKQQCARWSKK